MAGFSFDLGLEGIYVGEYDILLSYDIRYGSVEHGMAYTARKRTLLRFYNDVGELYMDAIKIGLPITFQSEIGDKVLINNHGEIKTTEGKRWHIFTLFSKYIGNRIGVTEGEVTMFLEKIIDGEYSH